MTATRAFRVAATSARVITGAVVAAACVVGVSAGVAAPWPTIDRDPARVQVTPLPGDTVLVCNGAFRALGRVSGDAGLMMPAAAPSLTIDGSDGVPEDVALDTPGFDEHAGSPSVLTGAVEGREAPLIAASESMTMEADDLRGLVAAPCREARTESWLVGGNVATGATDIVILTNAGEVTATVALDVYGLDRSSSTVIVPARTQVAVPLASIAAGAQTPVVRVSTEGAPVRAVLQSSLERTLDPVGADLQDALAGPQQESVFPGVQVFTAAGDGTDLTVLRMLAPDADGQATVRVTAESGIGAAEEFAVALTAGVPLEVSLGDRPAGTYTVEVASEAPVVAAVRQRDGNTSGTDFAWMTPAPVLEEEVLFAVPAGPTPMLHLAGTDTDATVTLTPLDGGQPQQIVVPAGGTVAASLAERTVYALSSTAPARAAVTMTAPGALASWPLWPAAGVEQSITVYP